MRNWIVLWLLVIPGLVSCISQPVQQERIITGAERIRQYTPYLENRRVGVVANHTSLVDTVHLVDTLLSEGVDIRRIFSPEHGFRGDTEAGANIQSYMDEKTGIPVISLYGPQKKPKAGHLKDIDIVVFDIQDVGVRFYTYISTMHYVMEACAETGTGFLVLDRPNPNGFYVDGPVLDTQYRSFVGMHSIPIVHGMTIAELGRMINQEGWLKDGLSCQYQWIACKNYTHDSRYRLPVKPSPNLPNMRSVYLYPSLGLFEGTVVNIGRGTDFPFQVFGHPQLKGGQIEYTPRSVPGASSNPKFENRLCRGVDLRDYPQDSLLKNPKIRLEWIQLAHQNIPAENFFRPFFQLLSGDDRLMIQLKKQMPERQIRHSWKKKLEEFLEMRKRYLIYEDYSSRE